MTAYITNVGVQQFSINLTAATTGTATINAVGSLAFILYGGVEGSSSSSVSRDFSYVTLTNSTTVTATKNTSTSTSIINGCVIDANSSLVNSVQYGTISVTAGNATGTATISAVTNNNAAIVYLGVKTDDSTPAFAKDLCVLTLSGTTVTATRNANASVNLTVSFAIVEFVGAALAQSVQQVAASSSSNVTSYTANFTAVTLANTLPIWSGAETAATTNEATGFQYGNLTDTTTLTVNINTGAAIQKNFNVSVVEFVSGVFNSAAQRGTTTLTGATSNTSSITGVTLANSSISWLGNSATSTTALFDHASSRCTLTNGTTVTVNKNSATDNVTASWEVQEWSTTAAVASSRVFDFMGFF